jgi:phosphatidylglycerophosphatase A
MSAKTFRESPHKLSLMIATMGGLGYAPVASGTVGTVGAVALHYLFMRELPGLTYILVWLILFEIACYTAQMVKEWLGREDPGIVVVDEMLGYLVAMFAIPSTAMFILGAFLIFRFFDIVKPWPANYFDRKVNNGLGIVMDDVVAGLYTNIILQFIKYLAT